MQFVGADRDRAGMANDMPLIGDEAERHGDREHHDGDSGRCAFHWGRRYEPAHRLEHQEDRAADQKGRLAERGQGLGLSMAKTVFAVGGNDCLAHREEVDE